MSLKFLIMTLLEFFYINLIKVYALYFLFCQLPESFNFFKDFAISYDISTGNYEFFNVVLAFEISTEQSSILDFFFLDLSFIYLFSFYFDILFYLVAISYITSLTLFTVFLFKFFYKD